MSDENYPYLADLTRAEFEAVTGILEKQGIVGLLMLSLELAEFNLRHNDDPEQKQRAENVARELDAVIERLEGFEELAE